VDGRAYGLSTMSHHPLSAYLTTPLQSPAPETLEAIERGPIDPNDALGLHEVERLLDPTPLPCETGWCTLPDGVGYVAVQTLMPRVSGEMIDWWFDWHPRESLRYRAWHPAAHLANSLQEPPTRRAKAHWGAIHHPVEDVGIGVVHARIEFRSPTEMGMTNDALEHPHAATIVCGYAGDDRMRVRHTPMFHVFLRDGEGLMLRSRFWLGAALRPFAPLLGLPGEHLLNTRFVRRRAIPRSAPRALAHHCAEEYANLSVLLGELYARYYPASEEPLLASMR
jgi:phloretin hydrolase